MRVHPIVGEFARSFTSTSDLVLEYTRSLQKRIGEYIRSRPSLSWPIVDHVRGNYVQNLYKHNSLFTLAPFNAYFQQQHQYIGYKWPIFTPIEAAAAIKRSGVSVVSIRVSIRLATVIQTDIQTERLPPL